MLDIKGFTKRYDKDIKAVDNLTLHVDAGDIFAFIGHNGAGKSTTIKAIAGILPFEEGDILINGTSIKKDPIKCKEQIAYIPDNPDLYESITGISYLNFIADIFNISVEDRKAVITKYAELFELTSSLNNTIGSYSHGMKQKLSLIGAFVHHPKLLILDEPFVGLDPLAAHIVKQAMKELCEQGSAIFFSTHVLEVAEKLCNKIAIIKKGKLISYGLMEDVIKDDSLEEVFLEQVTNA